MDGNCGGLGCTTANSTGWDFVSMKGPILHGVEDESDCDYRILTCAKQMQVGVKSDMLCHMMSVGSENSAISSTLFYDSDFETSSLRFELSTYIHTYIDT